MLIQMARDIFIILNAFEMKGSPGRLETSHIQDNLKTCYVVREVPGNNFTNYNFRISRATF